MPSTHDATTCDTCGQQILWTVTAAGRRQAVNAKPDPDGGRVAVHRDVAGRLRSRTLTADRPTLEGAEWLAMAHAATCTRPRPRGRTQPRPRPRVAPWRRWPR